MRLHKVDAKVEDVLGQLRHFDKTNKLVNVDFNLVIDLK